MFVYDYHCCFFHYYCMLYMGNHPGCHLLSIYCQTGNLQRKRPVLRSHSVQRKSPRSTQGLVNDGVGCITSGSPTLAGQISPIDIEKKHSRSICNLKYKRPCPICLCLWTSLCLEVVWSCWFTSNCLGDISRPSMVPVSKCQCFWNMDMSQSENPNFLKPLASKKSRSHITGDFGVFMDGRVFNGYGLVEAATQWEREAWVSNCIGCGDESNLTVVAVGS